MDRLRSFIVPALVAAFASTPPLAAGGAEIYGLFNDVSTVPSGEVLGAIDPDTGEITVIGDPLPDVGGRQSGLSDVDREGRVLYFSAGDGASGPTSLWSIDLDTGAVIAIEAFSGDDLGDSPFCIAWDPAGERLVGVARRTSDQLEIPVSIDPDTAVMTAIGTTPFDQDGFSSGVCDYDEAGGVLLFVANPPGETQRALFRLDTDTGAVLGSPSLTTETLGLDTTPGFFAWDPVTELGLAIVGGNLERRLGEIEPETGALTPVGATIASSGFSSGVSDFDPDAGVLHYVANDANGDPTLYQVSREGALLDNPVLSSDDPDIGTTPSFLAVVPAPEPGAAALGGAAAAALAAHARRRARKSR
jgi:hypothetical protein